jgi:carbon storage regulator
MLVLSRRIGERIVIDDNITVTVVEIRGGQIRLGVEAAPEIPVWREEVRAKREMVGRSSCFTHFRARGALPQRGNGQGTCIPRR